MKKLTLDLNETVIEFANDGFYLPTEIIIPRFNLNASERALLFVYLIQNVVRWTCLLRNFGFRYQPKTTILFH